MAPSLLEVTAQPGLFHGLTVEPEEARTILRPQRDERYGFGYALSPYRGCGHGCKYCYVREYPNALHGAEEWGRWSAPKLNAPELLWAQRHKLRGHSVFLSTATDPYQPLEQECRLTRRCLEVLLDCPETSVMVHTRSALVLRDLDLLKDFGPRLQVGISIPTDDDTVRQVTEPSAPAVPVRWATAERLAGAGIHVTIAATPLMPMENPRNYARRVRESGASSAWVGRLRLLKADPFYDILEKHGWLHVLKQEYADEMRDIISINSGTRRAQKSACRGLPSSRGISERASIPRSPILPVQRGLFDGVS